ncbi:MAG: mechanosensitive ion channel family protein [Thiothrix sp.]|nr:MAG: mechanosensitive ion channel family protein [Thiothrix sp.]
MKLSQNRNLLIFNLMNKLKLLSSFLLVILCCLPLSIWSAETPTAVDSTTAVATLSLEDHTKILEDAEKRLSIKTTTAELLDPIALQALNANQFATACISQQEAEQIKIKQGLDSIGTAPAQEDKELQTKRKDLDKQNKEVETRLAQCRLLALRANQIQEQVSLNKQAIVKERLFAASPSALSFVLQTLQQPSLWASETQQIISTLLALPINYRNVTVALMYGFAGLLAGLVWSIYKHTYSQQDISVLVATSPTFASVWRSIIRFMAWILLFGLTSLALLYKHPGVTAINELASTLFLFTISYVIISAMLRPATKSKDFTPVIPETSKKLYYWARTFLLAILLGLLFHSTLFDMEPPSSLVGLIRIILGTFSSLALIRLLWLLRRYVPWLQQYRLYILGAIALGAAIVALWLGYRNFFVFLFNGTFGTLFVILVGWLLLRIPTEILDGIDEGLAPWQKRLRKRLGVEEGKRVPGLIWLRLAHAVAIFSLMALVLLRLWGMSEQSLQLMLTKLMDGIKIGSFSLEPMRIIIGLLSLAILISLTHLIKSSLANHWLNRTNMTRGAKETTVTIAGYVGIILSILIGLSIAGIQFTNLAIIAGALSVGIGFGLQNIVNNFVSGLILLFERPIRKGDWIRVGTTEGYVRDINIRSTVIQTFDRSDIIVPNSELIANQVTNMMLSNQYGRVIIPVGVSYGSDPEKVLFLLRSVGEAHPAVLREYGELKVQVFFRGFAESSLNFELRCVIKDVEKQMGVTSELNLAIEKAFREAKIDMPYPQRTIHIASDSSSNKLPQKTTKAEDLS